ncbi:MAG: hypothetical protein LBR71_05325, partial [Synergistaceae bacterium]|nr:hypothetical protein [Synergistaceae bacterium]
LVRNRPAAVGAAVVHDDELEIAERLREYTLNCPRHKRFAVVREHYHGNHIFASFIIYYHARGLDTSGTTMFIVSPD